MSNLSSVILSCRPSSVVWLNILSFLFFSTFSSLPPPLLAAGLGDLQCPRAVSRSQLHLRGPFGDGWLGGGQSDPMHLASCQRGAPDHHRERWVSHSSSVCIISPSFPHPTPLCLSFCFLPKQSLAPGSLRTGYAKHREQVGRCAGTHWWSCAVAHHTMSCLNVSVFMWAHVCKRCAAIPVPALRCLYV